MRGRQPAGDDGGGAARGGGCKAGDEFRATAEIDAIGQPDYFHFGGGGEQPGDGRQRVRAFDGIGQWLELLQPDAGGGGKLQRNVAGGFAERDYGHTAIVRLGAGDDVVGGGKPRIPAGRGATAV